MSNLLERITRAQIEAGERVVMDDLREKGLLHVVTEADAVEEKIANGDLCQADGKPHEWRDVREEYGADRDGNRGTWVTRRECAKCGDAP